MSNTTNIINLANFRQPSPMRMLRSLCRRLIIADGPRIEHEILGEQIDRETDELLKIEQEAKQAETGLQVFAKTWSAALADGKIDDKELRDLERRFIDLKAPAHQHTQHIHELL